MFMNRRPFPALSLLLLMCIPAISRATVLTVPPGLNPGDQYRIVFVTSTTRDATSTDIADYDLFVNTVANSPGSQLAVLATNWKVIGSTATVDAFTHIGGNFPVPIYLLDGTRVATGAADLWDGSIEAPIELTELGTVLHTTVWTGTFVDGSAPPSDADCGTLGSPPQACLGVSDTSLLSWVSSNKDVLTGIHPFYGISDILTVEAQAVPEPGSLTLLGVGLLLLGGTAVRRRLSRRASFGSTPMAR